VCGGSGGGLLAECSGAGARCGRKSLQGQMRDLPCPDGVGATAVGKATKARDFCSDEVKKESDDEWTQIVVKGKNKMPAYDKKLTEAEIKDVVAYIRGLCKK
jgi:cytochrome c1